MRAGYLSETVNRSKSFHDPVANLKRIRDRFVLIRKMVPERTRNVNYEHRSS